MKKNGLMKICLFGGSNSILSHGLSKGLQCNTDFTNLALGASSSIQNSYELVRNSSFVSTDVDLIITESNVNDAHSVSNSGFDEELIIENIKRYYYELSLK